MSLRRIYRGPVHEFTPTGPGRVVDPGCVEVQPGQPVGDALRTPGTHPAGDRWRHDVHAQDMKARLQPLTSAGPWTTLPLTEAEHGHLTAAELRLLLTTAWRDAGQPLRIEVPDCTDLARHARVWLVEHAVAGHQLHTIRGETP